MELSQRQLYFKYLCYSELVEELIIVFRQAPDDKKFQNLTSLQYSFCLYGNEIDDTTSPIEAGLGWVTKFNKTFTNSAALLAEKEAGVKRRLIGFEMIDRGIPRHDYEIVDAEGTVIGKVTSGTQSPSLQKAIW